MSRDISKFYKTFSGTDSMVFMLLPNTPPILLGSITTISYSIYRDKKPVNLIGHINVKGFTRGTRVSAGTMIFTLINQHWVNEILESAPWLKEIVGEGDTLKADELPMFDLMIVSANEYGSYVSMFIYGVDVTDEAQVLSIEDLFTENQFSFVCRKIDTFSNHEIYSNNIVFKSNKQLTSYNDWTITMPNVYRNPSINSLPSIQEQPYSDKTVLQVQEKLKEKGYDVTVHGVYDSKTDNALKLYRIDNKIPYNYGLDNPTIDKILNGTYEGDTVITSEKTKTHVYESPSTNSSIMVKLPYKSILNIISEENGWYKTDKGYIAKASTEVVQNKVLDGITLLKEPGSYSYSFQDVLNQIGGFGYTVNSNEEKSVMFCIISYYNNEQTKTFRKLINYSANTVTTDTLDDYTQFFVYDSENGLPNMIEFSIFVDNQVYKWSIKYR